MRRARDLLLLVPLAACYLFIGRLNPDLPPHLPIFFGFILAFVLLPALGLGGLLVRQPLSLVERLALGGPVALFTLFWLSYVGAALRQPLLFWVQPAFGLLALLPLADRRAPLAPEEENSAGGRLLRLTPTGDLLLMTGILTAGLLLCLVKFLGSIPIPPTAAVGYATLDDGITSSFVFAAMRAMEHGLPIFIPMVEGATTSYHLLYHFCYAACAMVTSIHPMDLILFFWPPLLWLLLATATVTGCRQLAGVSLLESGLAAGLVLFTSGVSFFASPSVQHFDIHNTYFLGLPGVILFCAALYGYLTGRTPRLFAAHAASCYFLAAATKAPLLLLLPASLLPVLLLRLAKRQVRRSELVLAGLVLILVASLRLTLYPDTGFAVSGIPAPFKLLMGSINNLSEMLQIFWPYILLAMVALGLNPVLRLKMGRSGQYLLFCLGYVSISVVLLKMYNFVGGDFYFYWYARVLLLLAFAPLAAHILVWRYSRPLTAALVLLLVAGIGLTLQRMYLPYHHPDTQVSGIPQDQQVKMLDAGERTGLRWAATNLDHHRIFFTNKFSYMSSYLGGYLPQPLFDYLAFSGLQGYAFPMRWLPEATLRTASARIKELDSFHAAATAEAKAEIMARTPVDYYLHCIRLAPKDFVAPDCLRKVYANESLIIYENSCSPNR